MIKEACVETLAQSINAQKNGADRLELCADLQYDGITPDNQLISQVFDKVSIPIRVMIRPVKGGFQYSDNEILAMKKSIDFCKKVGVEGVVFGVCNPDNSLSIQKIRELALYSKPLTVTIHKAIDASGNPLDELKKLQGLKLIDSVLSSGSCNTAIEGIPVLKSMINLAKNIEVIACGKVTNKNISSLHSILKAKAYHGKLIVGDI